MKITEQGRKSLVRVAEWLESGAKHVNLANGREIDGFDMQNAICGTACCIAGAVCQFENLGQLEGNWMPYFGRNGAGTLATEFLGIDPETAGSIFEPWLLDHYDEFRMNAYNDPEIAAKVIRHFLKTGEVKWINFLSQKYDV